MFACLVQKVVLNKIFPFKFNGLLFKSRHLQWLYTSLQLQSISTINTKPAPLLIGLLAAFCVHSSAIAEFLHLININQGARDILVVWVLLQFNFSYHFRLPSQGLIGFIYSQPKFKWMQPSHWTNQEVQQVSGFITWM